MSYPYIQNTGKLREFLQKIPSIGVPDKLTLKFLEGLGFKSKNDRRIISVLKSIQFLDSSGTPTENYKNFRSKEKARAVMAECLRSAYEDLFKIYPKAYEESEEVARLLSPSGRSWKTGRYSNSYHI